MLGLGLGLGIQKGYIPNVIMNNFVSRVEADNGYIRNKAELKSFINFIKPLLPNTKLLFCPHLAVKLRESGNYKYVTKLYDIGPGMLDGAQTTALNQPYLSGNIAPTEKYAIKNPNGGNAYLTHTPISFAATDKWSVSTMLNANGQTGNAELCGDLGKSDIRINADRDVMFINSATPSAGSTVFNKYNKFYGKNTMLTFTSLGDGFLSLYINGAFISKNVVDTTSDFSGLLYSRDGNSLGLKGEIRYHSIRDIALSPTQVQDEYNYLRTLFPEIESVQIGTQTWATSNCEMTCTPQGNVIQEMKAATNADKLAQPINFQTDGWSTAGGGSIIDANTFATSISSGGVLKPIALTAGKYYKARIAGTSTSNLTLRSGSTETGKISLGTAFDTTVYINWPDNGGLYLMLSGNQSATISQFSFQEVGWVDSTNLYNYVYANTTGTAEQKEYAAVKAAAMWCYYNNDPALGAVYGKLYNWYAVKLLQMDIDYYNVANPNATWGWRVPNSSDFNTLISYLGGASVAGGKIKKEGLSYWTSPNAGADNSSGFSAIGSGIRFDTGSFSAITSYCIFSTTSGVSDHVMYYATKDSSSLILSSASRINGYILRLIKS